MPKGIAKNPELKSLRIKEGIRKRWPNGRVAPTWLFGKSSWNKGLKGESSHLFGKKRPKEVYQKVVETRRKNGSYKHSEETRRRIGEVQSLPIGAEYVLNCKGKYPRMMIKASETEWVLRSRLVMEKKLGRKLKHWEDVHHKDGDTLNDDPENLAVLSHGGHSSVTNLGRKRYHS